MPTAGETDTSRFLVCTRRSRRVMADARDCYYDDASDGREYKQVQVFTLPKEPTPRDGYYHDANDGREYKQVQVFTSPKEPTPGLATPELSLYCHALSSRQRRRLPDAV